VKVGPWVYFDKRYYASQAAAFFSTKRAAYSHYVRSGYKLGLNPNRYFSTLWYQWQNPNWHRRSQDPFSHYLIKGGNRRIDPSYLVDMVTYSRRAGGRNPVHMLFTSGGHLTDGVYPDLAVLEQLQADFLDAIYPIRLKQTEPQHRRPYLVHLQTGKPTAGKRLCASSTRQFDVLMNYYGPSGIDADVGEHVVFQTGSKFTAAYLLGTRFPEIYAGYRFVLFLDDDIEIDPMQVDDLFRASEAAGLELSQASLTPDSHCMWPTLFRRSAQRGTRYLNAVEIMMPLMSAQALQICLPHFRKSISGFGLDLLFGSLVSSARPRSVGILDDISVRHGKPIDDKAGAYYEFMRTNHINPKAELWKLITEFGLDKQIREVAV